MLLLLLLLSFELLVLSPSPPRCLHHLLNLQHSWGQTRARFSLPIQATPSQSRGNLPAMTGPVEVCVLVWDCCCCLSCCCCCCCLMLACCCFSCYCCFCAGTRNQKKKTRTHPSVVLFLLLCACVLFPPPNPSLRILSEAAVRQRQAGQVHGAQRAVWCRHGAGSKRLQRVLLLPQGKVLTMAVLQRCIRPRTAHPVLWPQGWLPTALLHV